MGLIERDTRSLGYNSYWWSFKPLLYGYIMGLLIGITEKKMETTGIIGG